MRTLDTLWENLAGSLGLKHRVSEEGFRPSQNMEFYHATFDNLLEGCQVMDFEWRYIYLNRVAEIHSRRPNKELIGKTFAGEYPGVETTEVYARIKQCLEERIPSRMVNRFVYPDNKVSWFLLSIQPVPEGAMIFSYDITDRIETERQLKQMARLYSTLSQVNQIIVRVREPHEMFRLICNVAVNLGQFSLAWIGLLDEQTGDVTPVAAAGLDIREWPFEKINIHEGNLKATVTATAIRLSRVVSNEDLQAMDIDPVFDQQLKNYPFRSVAAVPFRQGGKVIGTFSIISPESGFFRSQEEINLLEEMALDISFALETIETIRIKEQWVNAFEHCGHGIAIGNSSQDRFHACNPAFARMHGGTIEEICSRPISSYYLPEDLDFMREKIREADSTGSVQYEVRKKRLDGSLFHAQVNLVNVFDKEGKVLYKVTTQQDVSGKKLAENKLLASEEKFRKAFMTSPDAIAISRLSDGVCVSVNQSFKEMSGYSESEVVGMLSRDLGLWVNPEHREQMIEEVLKNGLYKNFETSFHLKDGSIRQGLLSAAIIEIDGEPHMLTSTHDITERKKIEEALKTSEAEIRKLNLELEERVAMRTAELQTANRELEAFTFSVSHDLRAPLRGVSGFVQILVEDYSMVLDQEGKRLCSVIQDNSMKMARLIDNLLAFSRLNRAGMSLEMVKMKDLASEVFQEAGEAGTPGKIDFRLGDLPEVKGDRNMLRQVWANLISNAIKYSSTRDKPVISITCKVEKGDAVFCVRDNGVGFDMKYRDKLFTVFQRLHNPKEFEGTGVGLAIVQRIILRHAGKVWAEGEVDQGASFYFSLPMMPGTK